MGYFDGTPIQPASLTSAITSNVLSGTNVLPGLPSVANLASNGTLTGSLVNNALDVAASNNNAPEYTKERLYLARPRSTIINNDNIGYGGDRGTRAYIKILTNSPDDVRKRSAGTYTNSYSKIDPLISSDGGKYGGYADFLLTGVSCSIEEKVQVTQVFGDAEVAYYFGRRPAIFNFTGMLVDSIDNNWFVQWLEMYILNMRGSQLAKNYELLKIVLPNMVITGTMQNFSWQQESANDVNVPFSFQFLAKSIEPTPAIATNGTYSPEIALLSFDTAKLPTLAQSSIEMIKKKATSISKLIQDPTTTSLDLAKLWASGVPTLDAPGGVTDPINTASSDISNFFKDFSNTLTGIRTSLFSPVYGVLSSLTRLVKTVTGTLASASIFTSQVLNVLRDIQNISYQAANIVAVIEALPNSLAMQAASVKNNIENTIASLKRTKGVISNAPATIKDSLRAAANTGGINGKSPFLTASIGNANSGPILALIANNRSAAGLSLPLGSGHRMEVLAVLNTGPVRTPDKGAVL